MRRDDAADVDGRRRRLLGTASLGALGLAGCLGDGTNTPTAGTARPDGGTPTSGSLSAPDSWQEVTSVEDTVAAYPNRIDTLLGALDTEREDMSDVRAAMDDGDTVGACEALLAHHREGDHIDWLRDPEMRAGDRAINRATDIVENDVYWGFAVKTQIPRQDNGHLDWDHLPPNGDLQYANRVNRHGPMVTLMRAYLGTGEERYLDRLDRDLRDWLIAADSPPIAAPFGHGALEPANRMPKWATIFYGLQGKDGFQPATRLLMLASITVHPPYLLRNPGGNNWVTMTQYGVLTGGVCWPEFADADRWRAEALDNLEFNARQTVYDDGAQKELTSTYHELSADRYQRSMDLLQNAGIEPPAEFRNTTRSMWAYQVQTLRPDGTVPLNNDTDLHSNAAQLRRLADVYDEPTWRYIVTNGAEGERPPDPPSRYFPDAGQLVSRSGWDEGAQWSFFDHGPLGSGHQHWDWGHLSVTAFGRDLLTDSGRFAYQGDLAEQFRAPYARHTRGHNTILIDGAGQASGISERDSPHAVKPAFDFAVDRYDRGYEGDIDDTTHGRAVVYLRDVGWIVADHVAAESERTIQPLWHLHPDCTVEMEGTDVVTTDAGEGNVRVTPAGDVDWSLSMVEGQEDGSPQGWYSRTYGEAEPSPTAVYETTAAGGTFGWVISVAEEAPEQPAVEWLDAPAGVARLRVGWQGEPTRTVTIVVDAAQRPYTLPDGRTLDARLLIEGGSETHVAYGELRDGDGTVVASHAAD
jgi:hypothetical protein